MTHSPNPPIVEPKFFSDAEDALDYVRSIYADQIRYLTGRFQDFASGKELAGRQRAFYP